MCRMCDDPTLTPADMRAMTLQVIEEFGWQVQYVEPEGAHPSLAYTVGLTGVGAPELQVVGLPDRIAALLLNTAAAAWISGELRLGDMQNAPNGARYRLVPHIGHDELFVARDLYGSSVRVVDLRRVRR